MKLPRSHPRYQSLKTRQLIEKGVRDGITSHNGLIAHGRGEAFDYLLGEKTNDFALNAIESAASMLLLARHPIISVNGNTAVLVPKELVRLSNILGTSLEINLFHTSDERLRRIKKHLQEHGGEHILLPEEKIKIDYLNSPRKYVNAEGIYKADVVFVPLEDGDRTEALIKNGKKVITVDLNPLSRTAQTATLTIVDNIVRTMPLLIKTIINQRKGNEKKLKENLKKYNNLQSLATAIKIIRRQI
jgi:4-phosphopantoate---beta-alanine ligase